MARAGASDGSADRDDQTHFNRLSLSPAYERISVPSRGRGGCSGSTVRRPATLVSGFELPQGSKRRLGSHNFVETLSITTIVSTFPVAAVDSNPADEKFALPK